MDIKLFTFLFANRGFMHIYIGCSLMLTNGSHFFQSITIVVLVIPILLIAQIIIFTLYI